MRVLAIDTSTSRISVALVEDGKLVCEGTAGDLVGSQLHGEALASMVKEVLSGDIPDVVAVGLGPGPYTGLRVGVVTAEMLAHAWRCELRGVSTLAAIAHGHRRRGGGACNAVLDVKRREIAWQSFDETGRALTDPALVHIDDLSALAGWPIVGPAFESQKLVQPDVLDSQPVSALDIALLSMTHSEPQFAPLYLRQPDATEPAPRKQVNNG